MTDQPEESQPIETSGDIKVSALEVYAMVIGRDALIEQIFTAMGAENVAALWRSATKEIDGAIRAGLVEVVKIIGDES